MKIYVSETAGAPFKAYDAIEGWTIMEILKDHGLPLKAECGGACCCATCHIYVIKEWQDRLPQISEDEEEMLDMAPDVTENSRLSCQIIMEESLDGIRIQLGPTA